MDFLSKVQKVKKNIAEWQKKWGDDFAYLIIDFTVENESMDTVNVYISKNEHRDILKYLASVGYLEITDNNSDSPQIKILPKTKPIIRLKSLELIARDIGELDSGHSLVNFLIECGVDKKLIVYPNTKWRMVYSVLMNLSCSRKREDRDALSKIIGEATHPLMHGGDTSAADILRKEFNGYLSYDNFGIGYDKNDGSYWALRKIDDESEIRIQMEEESRYYEEQSKKQLEFLSKTKNKEKISLLQKAYQLLTNVVFFFCEDPTHPKVELNQNFQYLCGLVNITINELGLWQIDRITPFSRNRHFFNLQFSNLFSAEKVYWEQGKELNWQEIRPEMNAMYGDIEELYQEVGGNDILIEPDKQKKLNEIQNYLLKLKEKNKKEEGGEKNSKSKDNNTKYRITYKSRQIILNNKYLINKFQFDRPNELFFEYIYKNSKKKVKVDEIKKATGKENKIDFNKFVNNIGFKGELRSCFFDVSKATIKFTNPLTQKDLEERNINISKLKKQIKELKSNLT